MHLLQLAMLPTAFALGFLFCLFVCASAMATQAGQKMVQAFITKTQAKRALDGKKTLMPVKVLPPEWLTPQNMKGTGLKPVKKRKAKR